MTQRVVQPLQPLLAGRRPLVAALLALLVVLAAAVVYLLLGSMRPTPYVDPSERLGYLDVRLKDIEPGGMTMVVWNDQPYAVVRPTDAMLASLTASTGATWSRRAIAQGDEAFFVLSLVSTDRGCVVAYAPAGAERYVGRADWIGGFFDPCHSGEWDYAGRTLLTSRRLDDLARPVVSVPTAGTVRLHK